MSKKAKLILFSFLGVIVISFVISIMSLGFIIKKTVNKVGPSATQTSVVLNSASLNLFAGSASLNDLTVANPEGFTNPNALALKNFEVELQSGSVFGSVIEVDLIKIDGLSVSFEGITGDNLQQIKNNVNEFIGASEAASEEEKEETGKSDTEGKKFHVKKIILDNIEVKAAVLGKSFTIPIPRFEINELGNSEKGASAAELFANILDGIISAALKAVGDKTGDLGGAVKDATEGLGKDIQEESGKLLDKINPFGK